MKNFDLLLFGVILATYSNVFWKKEYVFDGAQYKHNGVNVKAIIICTVMHGVGCCRPTVRIHSTS